MADDRVPLQIHLLFHPRSQHARELARRMFAELAAAPAFPGPRIPVLYACDDGGERPPSVRSLRLHDAQHNLVCLLADERMARVVRGGQGLAWGRFARTLLRSVQPRPRTAVLPVALDGGAFALHQDLARTSFVRLDAKPGQDLQASELFFQIAVRALELLARHDVTAAAQAPVAPLQVFVSHAKANLPRDPERQDGGRGAVLALLDYLAQGPVRAWFDSSQIRPGDRFDRAIRRGVGTSTAFLAVRTDQYSSREWCRREFLRARELALPIVVVDALTDADPVSFPYFGNVPTIRWRDDTAGLSMPRQIVQVLLQEALRHAVVALQQRGRGRRTHCLSRPPDLLSLREIPPGARTVVYPDPPLPRELQALLAQSRPRRTFTTPMLQATLERRRSLAGRRIGLSVAEASDVHRRGKGDEHLRLLVDDLSVLLLLARAHLGYGGWLRGSAQQDYTTALIDRARYLPAITGKQPGGGAHHAPVTNFVSWPKHLDVDDDELKVYGRAAHLVACRKPRRLPVESALAEDASGFFRRQPPKGERWDEPLRQARLFAYARGLSIMREEMNAWLDARICIGGKLAGYSGLLPGIVEEALLALRAKKPVFLLAAFGGATELVADGLRGASREELSTAYARQNNKDYDAQRALYAAAGVAVVTPEEVAAELKSLGAAGIAAALANGLDDDENEELLACTEPFRIAELVAQGMGSPGRTRQRRR